MGVIYTKTDQSSNVSTGTGVPTHSAVAGDRYTNLSNGNTYQYTTSWQQVAYGAGGLTYFTEAQSTASPNATVNVDSLTAVAGTTDADFVIRPKGTGAILGRIPDGTVTGGNKRGTNAVDLQTFISNAANHVASGAYSVVVGGSYNKATGLSSSVLGGSSNTAASTGDSVLGGDGNGATGGWSIAGGRYSQANATTSVAFGYQCIVNGLDASVAMGYANTITGGYHTTVFGGYNTTSGYQHFVGGESNTISSGTACVVLGKSNTVSGTSSIAIGANNNATANYSVVLGYLNTASGLYSQAYGIGANTFSTTGRFSFSSSYISSGGDSQKSTLILAKRTTDATPSILSVDTGVATTSNQLTLQNNNVFRVKGSITGKQSASTNVGVWDIDCVIVRGANAASTVIAGTPTVTLVVNTGSFGNPTLTANTTLGCLTVTVIGVAATNIQWTCAIDTCETIYA
jgi:hypothetical protein